MDKSVNYTIRILLLIIVVIIGRRRIIMLYRGTAWLSMRHAQNRCVCLHILAVLQSTFDRTDVSWASIKRWLRVWSQHMRPSAPPDSCSRAQTVMDVRGAESPTFWRPHAPGDAFILVLFLLLHARAHTHTIPWNTLFSFLFSFILMFDCKENMVLFSTTKTLYHVAFHWK